MIDQFLLNGPIPGSSLTGELGNKPWEQPAKFSELKDVVDYYSDKFVTAEAVTVISDALSADVPVVDLAESLMLNGVMKGIHTIDLGVIAVPVIAELIKTIGDISGVGYIVDVDDVKTTKQISEKTIQKVIKDSVSKVKEAAPVIKGGLMSKGSV